MKTFLIALALTVSSALASAQTLTVPSTLYQAGIQNAGPAVVDVGLTHVSVTFTREAWPAGVVWTDAAGNSFTNIVLVPRIEISYDGGLSWPDFVSSAWSGGTRINRFGQTVTSETLQRDLPQPTNPNRRIRASVQVLAPTRTAITLTAK